MLGLILAVYLQRGEVCYILVLFLSTSYRVVLVTPFFSVARHITYFFFGCRWRCCCSCVPEDYQLLGEVLDKCLKELGYPREDPGVEVFASDKPHVLDLYCSKGKNCSYKFYWPSFGMAYGNPRFSEPQKVLTKVALERSRMVLCSPDWEAHGGNEYWRNLLDRLTISSVRLPDEAIYVPLGRKTPIGKPGWGSMLSVVDGGLTSIPWEDLDPSWSRLYNEKATDSPWVT